MHSLGTAITTRTSYIVKLHINKYIIFFNSVTSVKNHLQIALRIYKSRINYTAYCAFNYLVFLAVCICVCVYVYNSLCIIYVYDLNL